MHHSLFNALEEGGVLQRFSAPHLPRHPLPLPLVRPGPSYRVHARRRGRGRSSRPFDCLQALRINWARGRAAPIGSAKPERESRPHQHPRNPISQPGIASPPHSHRRGWSAPAVATNRPLARHLDALQRALRSTRLRAPLQHCQRLQDPPRTPAGWHESLGQNGGGGGGGGGTPVPPPGEARLAGPVGSGVRVGVPLGLGEAVTGAGGAGSGMLSGRGGRSPETAAISARTRLYRMTPSRSLANRAAGDRSVRI